VVACSADNIQHWKNIVFQILSPELGDIVDLHVNKPLDIRMQENEEEVSFPQLQVIEFLNVHDAFRNPIEVIDIDYTIICASSLAPAENLTAINVTKLIPSENVTDTIIE
jgi:hypothetical protein